MHPITRSTYARCHGDRGADKDLLDSHGIQIRFKRGAKDAVTDH
jgi:hypothetical protein